MQVTSTHSTVSLYDRVATILEGLRRDHRYPWDAPLVTLPTSTAIRDYLIGQQAPAEVADTACREMAVPLHVTKRGALILATASQHDASAGP